MRELEKVIGDLQPEVDRLTAELQVRERDLSATVAAEQEAITNTEAARVRLKEARGRARGRVISLYESGPAAIVDAIMGSRDIQAARLRVDYVNAVLQSDRALVDTIRVAETDYRDKADKLEKVRVRQTEVRNQVAAVQKDRATHLDAQKKARDDQAAERDVKKDLLGKVEQDENEYGALLEQERRDLLRVSGLLARVQSGQPIPAGVVAGLLALPAVGPVLSGFGYRTHPIFGDVRFHSGVDLGVPYGDPIHAAASGTVVDAGWMGGYGNAVVIDHGNGIATLYAHMSALAVDVGAAVDTGSVIGYCGSTGYSTGPHLHFEVHVGGEPVDPLPWLGIQ